jgi:hypothetical protein
MAKIPGVQSTGTPPGNGAIIPAIQLSNDPKMNLDLHSITQIGELLRTNTYSGCSLACLWFGRKQSGFFTDRYAANGRIVLVFELFLSTLDSSPFI